MPDPHWCSHKLCLISYELDIHVFVFDNCFFIHFKSDLSISYFKTIERLSELKPENKLDFMFHIIAQI